MTMFDPEKTKAFFGLAAPYIEKFRDSCLSTIYDNPEAIAHTLRPLAGFGLWNIPGLDWPGSNQRATPTQQELLHDAIFRSEEAGARYPLLDSSFSRAGITKFFMFLEQSGGDFYPQRWLDEELLALAKTARSVLAPVRRPDDLPTLQDMESWRIAALAVIERLVKLHPWNKRGFNDYSDVETIVAFVAPPALVANCMFERVSDSIDTTGAHGSHSVAYQQDHHEAMMPFIDFVRDVMDELDELAPETEPMPPVTGFEPGDVSPLVPPGGEKPNGNGNRVSPSISMLASHFGEPLIPHRSADPLRELFDRTQAMPKHEVVGHPQEPSVSQVVTDTVAMVKGLAALGVQPKDALDAAVQLLRSTEKGEN